MALNSQGLFRYAVGLLKGLHRVDSSPISNDDISQRRGQSRASRASRRRRERNRIALASVPQGTKASRAPSTLITAREVYDSLAPCFSCSSHLSLSLFLSLFSSFIWPRHVSHSARRLADLSRAPQRRESRKRLTADFCAIQTTTSLLLFVARVRQFSLQITDSQLSFCLIFILFTSPC